MSLITVIVKAVKAKQAAMASMESWAWAVQTRDAVTQISACRNSLHKHVIILLG